MPPHKRTQTQKQKTQAEQMLADNEAKRKEAELQMAFETVFEKQPGMRVYNWLMEFCGIFDDNEYNNSNVYRQEGRRVVANKIRQISPRLFRSWLESKERGE